MYTATIQLTHCWPALRMVFNNRVLLEQLRERLIQAQKNKSFDLNSLQMILDYYGISKENIKSKNEAIELILRSYQDRHSITATHSQVIVLKSEAPKSVSLTPKLDFRVLNEAAGFTFLSNFPKGPENCAFSYNGQNFALGLDIRPISSVVTPYERIMQYEARRSWAQFCIEHDIGLYPEYKAQRARCIEFIKRMLDYSTNLDALGAQLSVNSLYLLDVYDEGAILCDWVKPGIQNILFKDGNFVGIDSQEKLGKLLHICHLFLKEVLPQKEYIELLQEYKCKNIPGADILIKRILGTNGYWDAIKCLVSDCFSSAPHALDSEIAHSRMVQNSIKVLELCKNEKFDEARKIVASLRIGHNPETARHLANEAHYLSLLVENEYSTIFNSYDIRYTDTADPYYIVAKDILDTCPYPERSPLQEIFQKTISNRRNALNELLKTASTIQRESPFIKAVGYKILDAQNDNEIVDILYLFSNDHADDNVRNAYSVFVSKGLPRVIAANECAQKIDMPLACELSVNEDIRKWYGYCASLKIESGAQKELITCALVHLKKACTDNENRAQHLYMVQRFYEDAAGSCEEKLFLKLSTLAHQFDKPIQNQLHNELLKIVCERLQSAQDEVDTLTTIEIAQDACQAIRAQKIKTAQELEKLWDLKEPAVLSGTSEIYPEKELEMIKEEEFEVPYGCGNSIFDEIGRRFLDFSEAIFELDEPYGGICFPGSERAKNLYDPELQEIEEEIDVDRIPQCNGGQQTLSSFGESIEEPEKGQESEKDIIDEQAEGKEKIEELIKAIIKNKTITEEQHKKIGEFTDEVLSLIKEYGLETVSESMEIYNVTFEKISKRNVINAITILSKKLSLINESNELIKTFKYDPAHQNSVSPSGVQEAIAAKGCMEQGILGKLKRSTIEGADFFEIESGKLWDVKTASSESLEGKHIFDIVSFIKKLKESLKEGENIILQITDLLEPDWTLLFKEIIENFSKEELKRAVVIDATDAKRSLSTKKLLQIKDEDERSHLV